MAKEDVIESGRRFSQSALWEMQRRFFEQRGPEAWSAGLVPHQVTSSPFIAGAYARIVLGFLRDAMAAGGDAEPIHIVELGSGSGRFAQQFLRKLTALIERLALPVRFRYVMTDFTDANLEPWRNHPALAGWVAAGVLDFARLDVGACDQIDLMVSGTRLRAGALTAPLVVIGNYVFDGTPCDLFLVRSGRLHELTATLSAAPGADLAGPGALGQVTLALEAGAAAAPGYYGEALLDDVLVDYRDRLADTVLSFPCAALRCVQALHRLAGGRLLLLSADKGYHLEEDLLRQGPPALALHGSFSMAVNYHAVGEAVRRLGGTALLAGHRSSILDICGFALGAPQGGYRETQLAFEDALDTLGPDDVFTLRKSIEPALPALGLPALLALLRLCGSDPEVLWRCLPALRALVPTATLAARQEVHRVVQQTWSAYVPIGEERDLAFELGALLYAMDYLPEAREFFARSLDEHAPDAATLFNLALCHFGLRELGPAQQRVEQALVLMPELESARDLRIRLRTEVRP